MGSVRRAVPRCALLILAAVIALPGCSRKEVEPPEVIVYTALDRGLSAPIFEEFTKKTGIVVRARYDADPEKAAGLAEAILSERARPRCDLFWNDEILSTLRLERAGLLRAYQSPAVAGYPASAHSSNGTWYGFAARARVLLINTHQLPEERRPKSIRDLIDPQWYDRCGMSKPLFGTTAAQVAALFAVWRDEKAKEFYHEVKRNVRILSGNKQVAQAVGSARYGFGLTDTDAAVAEVEKGMPVTIVYPDQREGEVGTLFIPNTLALIKDSAHPKEAEKLLDYLLSADVERQLAKGPSAQIPLQAGVEASPRVKTPGEVRAMEVDWSAAAGKWDAVAEFLKTEFAVDK